MGTEAMTEAMFDHIGINTGDLPLMVSFYEQALLPLGMTVQMRVPRELTGRSDMVGIGGHKPLLWLYGTQRTTPGLHIAFRAETRADVDAFYAAALAAGGKDNGAPGIREHYHPNYYGAFVIDPEGHNVEAVCQKPGA